MKGSVLFKSSNFLLKWDNRFHIELFEAIQWNILSWDEDMILLASMIKKYVGCWFGCFMQHILYEIRFLGEYAKITCDEAWIYGSDEFWNCSQPWKAVNGFYFAFCWIFLNKTDFCKHWKLNDQNSRKKAGIKGP